MQTDHQVTYLNTYCKILYAEKIKIELQYRFNSGVNILNTNYTLKLRSET